MTFAEEDRQIYTFAGDPKGRQYDPLRVERKLRIASKGRLNDHLDAMAEWDKLSAGGGDREQLREAEVAAAVAEEEVVRAAREAFSLDLASDLDAFALALLSDFLGWLSGKGSPAASGPTSPPPGSLSAPGITTSSSP